MDVSNQTNSCRAHMVSKASPQRSYRIERKFTVGTTARETVMNLLRSHT